MIKCDVSGHSIGPDCLDFHLKYTEFCQWLKALDYWSEAQGFKPQPCQAATAGLLSKVLNPPGVLCHDWLPVKEEFHCAVEYMRQIRASNN